MDEQPIKMETVPEPSDQEKALTRWFEALGAYVLMTNRMIVASELSDGNKRAVMRLAGAVLGQMHSVAEASFGDRPPAWVEPAGAIQAISLQWAEQLLAEHGDSDED